MPAYRPSGRGHVDRGARALRVATAVALAAILAAAGVGFAAPAPAYAQAANAKGWYSPVGAWTFGRMGGFGVWRTDRTYHLAKDVSAPVGRPVYALSDGYVYDAYSRLAGYAPAGAMIVVYRTHDGRWFKALYGHVRGLKYRKGQKVRAGAVLAYVAQSGSSPHLHFGIHMGLGKPNDPRRNPFMGHGRVRGRTYGWVDPVRFLSENYAWGVTPPAPPSAAPTATLEPTPTPAPSPEPTPGITPAALPTDGWTR
ncbi:MAG TPA: M23 family metallopeptidase [Coriobacteriia bacterium]